MIKDSQPNGKEEQLITTYRDLEDTKDGQVIHGTAILRMAETPEEEAELYKLLLRGIPNVNVMNPGDGNGKLKDLGHVIILS